ncbi:hypothetical protein TNIN_282391 [Trichonephila inaurata madagascariensis]|uniref:Uncharacterized protein n=1 Tax=Trichonephila inaurata madagascariensis TaxID=2747483 RepID=A0A8X7CN03_9ARAC|nr:hypothetical protein TNIN_282391 [Trichonephila inaurata madagascariensis]
MAVSVFAVNSRFTSERDSCGVLIWREKRINVHEPNIVEKGLYNPHNYGVGWNLSEVRHTYMISIETPRMDKNIWMKCLYDKQGTMILLMVIIFFGEQ